MSSTHEDCHFHEIFTRGRWTFKKVSGSQPIKYATVTERNYCWTDLARPKEKKEKHASKPISEQHITETSKIMKRDIQTKMRPWISVTHKDFYGQDYQKMTAKPMETKLPVNESKPENMDKLVCSISHVPIIRIKCYEDDHFNSLYNRNFTDPGPPTIQSDFEKHYDFSRKIKNSAVPYSSKNWITSYKLDYGELPKIKSNERVTSDVNEVHIARQALY